MFNSEVVEKLKERIEACGDEGWATVDKELLEHCLFCMRHHCTYLIDKKYVKDCQYAWVEFKGIDATILALVGTVFDDGRIEFISGSSEGWSVNLKDYNIKWRCWTAIPFDDIRDEVKWVE